jgi:hypothetical protein
MQLLKTSAKSALVGFKPAPVGFICGQLMRLLSAQSAQVGFEKAGTSRFYLWTAHAVAKISAKSAQVGFDEAYPSRLYC